MSILRQLSNSLRTDGYQFVRGGAMRAMLEQNGPLADWPMFAESWNDLGTDTYMADGGRYRKRRHAVLAVSANGIIRQPRQPHFQSRDYNVLNGGIERWFEPVTEAVAASSSLTTILASCRILFDTVSPTPTWNVEVHQFRIEARAGEAGRPTPEGMHRDGVDYVLVLLVNRTNIVSGLTSVHDLAGNKLGEFTLTQPFDAAVVDDARVMHGVTPVGPLDPQAAGYRDVLVVTFRRG